MDLPHPHSKAWLAPSAAYAGGIAPSAAYAGGIAPRVASAEHSPFALAPRAGMFGRMKVAIGDWRRDRKNAALAQRLRKQPRGPYPDHGYSVFTGPMKANGLCRAYRYEIDRLKAEGLYNPHSRNLLILGQPRQYRKLLRETPLGFESAYRIGLWVTEFDIMPPDWAFATDLVHELWTPSTFSAQALKATGLPIKVQPHAVRVAPGPAFPRERFNVPDHDFLGLAIMDLGTCPDRKNPLAHIAAWRTAFGDDPNAILLMKVRLSRHKAFVRLALESTLRDYTNIRLVEEEFTDRDITAFQRMADVYLSLHRAEGYGLNIHEMLELGVPVVATGYSGNMQFMSNYSNANFVTYQRIPYEEPTLYFRGSNLFWADADTDDAARILREVRRNSKRKAPN